MTERDDLCALELALARRDEAQINGGFEAVLHEHFVEFGSSGRVWTRAEILEMLQSPRPEGRMRGIAIETFDVAELAPHMRLVTFVTAGIRSSDGQLVRSRRSSIWVRDGDRWQVRFHQGTPLTTS